MVSTRGNRDNGENDSKFNLPARECRKSSTTLQEPEDEMFWESDDPTPQAKLRKKNIVTFSSKTKGCSSTVSPRRGSMLSDDMIGVDGDTDTDDEMFSLRKTRCSLSSKPRRIRDTPQKGSILRPVEKEFVMNGDDEMSDKSDCELAPRRSSRQRKFTFYSESWLVGDKKLKGYPSMIHNSEPENDEPRAAQKAHRFGRVTSKNKSPVLPRRSQRSKVKFDPIDKQKSRILRSPINLRKYSGRSIRDSKSKRYHEEFEQSEEDEDDDEDREDEEEEREVKEEEMEERDLKEAEKESLTNLKKGSKKLGDNSSKKKSRPGRPRRHHNDTSYAADAENTDEDIYRRPYFRRSSKNLRNMVHQHPKLTNYRKGRRRISESECEEKMDMDDLDQSTESNKIIDAETEKDRKLTRCRDPIVAFAMKYGSKLQDIPKRQRKPVSRFTYEVTNKKRCKVRDFSDEENPSQEEEEDESEEEDNGERKYSLRKNRNNSFKEKSSHTHRDRNRELEKFLKSPARKRVYNKKKVAHSRASSSSSSSSDEKDFNKRKAKAMSKARSHCLPMNFTADDLLTGIRDRTKTGASLADIDPMTIDKSVNFDSIGGLSHHIRSLKEMIIFPFMYPEIFQKFRVSPPRGVLFYGPPGTGKTLVARALANECSQDDKKIAFFMRKGADCLSKWVGESERQLRLLFDQAYQMRPSIIFFDEIDGLAPVRSSRQDQIHSSIVSTLLALMDGLDSREEIVVIGATNRIDAIDPALRRPGRFDREFHFPLPSVKARQQILSIHTEKWNPPLSKEIINTLAERTVGYCGADLKSLCAEATLFALRNKYPQIYESKQKLLLDPSKLEVKFSHFRHSLAVIVPAGQRSTASPGRKLNRTIMPLLKPQLEGVVAILRTTFPQGFFKAVKCRSVYRPRLLLAGRNGQGQTAHLAPAAIHVMEKISVHKLDLPALHSVSAWQPEEACAQVFHEARRSTPSILFVPLIDKWWASTPETVKATFLTLLSELEPSLPLLLLATSDTPYPQLDQELQVFFSEYRKELFSMTNPQSEQRKQFFRPVFYVEMLRKPKVPIVKKRVYEPLPLAPPPEPRKRSEEELRKLEYIEEASLRELRIFLRQICAKLAKNKMFYPFTKPVDVEEVPDYCEIISTPMDLETMMTKIDRHDYECAEDFLKDVDLICSNALEYNPDRTPEDKIIRHKACTLRDTAYAYIKAEMDTDFEEKCRDIRRQRKKRKFSKSAPHFLGPLLLKKPVPKVNDEAVEEAGEKKEQQQPAEPQADNPTPEDPLSKSATDSSKRRKYRKAGKLWARGHVPKKRRLSEKGKLDDSKEEEHAGEESNVHSTELADGTPSTATTAQKNGLESESTLYNGEVSTEDSRDSMTVTSAADLLTPKVPSTCPSSSSGEPARATRRSSQCLTENDDSIVSSSEQGGTVSAADPKREITIDHSHLDAVFNSCISATDGCTVEQLHHLYIQILTLTQRHNSSLQRNDLLHEVETEIRRFAQFQDNR